MPETPPSRICSISQALGREKHRPGPERARGPRVSVYLPADWLGLGHHEAREWKWGAQAVPSVETRKSWKDWVACPAPHIAFPPCDLLLFLRGEVGGLGSGLPEGRVTLGSGQNGLGSMLA